jgi:hypothetical protein
MKLGCGMDPWMTCTQFALDPDPNPHSIRLENMNPYNITENAAKMFLKRSICSVLRAWGHFSENWRLLSGSGPLFCERRLIEKLKFSIFFNI